MMQAIGIMVGLYTLLRFSEMSNNPMNGGALKTFAVIFAVINVLLLLGIILT